MAKRNDYGKEAFKKISQPGYKYQKFTRADLDKYFENEPRKHAHVGQPKKLSTFSIGHPVAKKIQAATKSEARSLYKKEKL